MLFRLRLEVMWMSDEWHWSLISGRLPFWLLYIRILFCDPALNRLSARRNDQHWVDQCYAEAAEESHWKQCSKRSLHRNNNALNGKLLVSDDYKRIHKCFHRDMSQMSVRSHNEFSDNSLLIVYYLKSFIFYTNFSNLWEAKALLKASHFPIICSFDCIRGQYILFDCNGRPFGQTGDRLGQTIQLFLPVVRLVCRYSSFAHTSCKMMTLIHWLDPRLKNWFLMTSPQPTLVLIATYFLFVKFGPIYMRDREPVKLKWILVFYNLVITLFNGWMAFEVYIHSSCF